MASSGETTESGAPAVQEAAAFLTGLRSVQKLRGRRLTGKSKLPQVNVCQFAGAQDHTPLPRAIRKAIARTEEMCRRCKIPLPDRLRPHVYALLADELRSNAWLFRTSLEKVVSATVLNGDMTALIESEEFEPLRDTPWILREAALHHVMNPADYLRGVIRNVEVLERDEEFASLRDTPWMFRQASAMRPTDPRAFLRAAMQTVLELEQDDEFISLRETPAVFRQAAMGWPSNPKAFLRRVMRNICSLQKIGEFAHLRDTPWVFRAVAVGRPGDAKGFLREVVRTVRALETDPEFAALRATPAVFLDAAVYHRSDPRDYLRSLL